MRYDLGDQYDIGNSPLYHLSTISAARIVYPWQVDRSPSKMNCEAGILKEEEGHSILPFLPNCSRKRCLALDCGVIFEGSQYKARTISRFRFEGVSRLLCCGLG